MRMPRERPRWLTIATILCLLAVPCAAASSAPSADGSPAVEVYWQGTARLRLTGITSALVLDEEICRVEADADGIVFYGLKRGETVVHLWTGEIAGALLVRVIDKPVRLPAPRLSAATQEALGRGSIGSTVTVSSGGRDSSQLLGIHRFDWTQAEQGERITIRSLAQNGAGMGLSKLNIGTLGIEIANERRTISLLDFALDTAGGLKARVPPVTNFNALILRGASVAATHGASQVQAFAGVSVPGYYLSLAGTRAVAGVNFSGDVSPGLRVFSTTAFTSVPPVSATGPQPRERGVFQTLGATYRRGEHWALTGMAGASNRGGMAQAGAAYEGGRGSAFVSGTLSARRFPLNQLQLFYSGATSVTSGATLRWNERLTAVVGLQHSASPPTGLTRVSGNSTNVSPGVNLRLTRNQQVALTYTFQESELAAGSRRWQRTNRYQGVLQSLFGRVSNTLMVESSHRRDDSQSGTQRDFTARELATIPFGAGALSFGFSHFRAGPTALARARARYSLLDPVYQQWIETDPSGFRYADLPESLQEILKEFLPTNTELHAGASFHVGRRLTVAPRASVTFQSEGLPGSRGRSENLGYSLNYQITPSTQLQSSLTEMLLLNAAGGRMTRARVVTFGVHRTFTGGARFLALRGDRGVIQGRIYRDMNVDGVPGDGEPGLGGIRVELEGHGTTTTDAGGRYVFARLGRGTYRLRVPLSQFTTPVRVTSPTDVSVDLVEDKSAVVNVGVVNFARVMGDVFNDYRLDGARQPGAPGLQRVRLTLEGPPGRYAVETDSNGQFEAREVLPGEYILRLEPDSLPPGYRPPEAPLPVSVRPTSTVLVETPVRALRSVAGRVLFQPPAPPSGETAAGVPEAGAAMGGHSPGLRALAGVRVSAGGVVATTDAEGRFLLRDLPAGEQTLMVLSYTAPPPAVRLPAGRFKLAFEPAALAGITITISNPEALRYILPDVAETSLAHVAP